MILITGATGQLGRATTKALCAKAPKEAISVMVRDTTKVADLQDLGVEILTGDYTDVESMVQAFKGVQKLLLVSSNHQTDRFVHHKNVIEAAKVAGVKKIYYTGFDMQDLWNTAVPFLALPHAETIEFLKNSGITFTIINNNLYAELIPGLIGADVLDEGVFVPAGDGKVPFLSQLDMAEATANILLSDGLENQTIVLAGLQAYSFQDIADMLSIQTGKKIKYSSPDHAAFLDHLADKGQPEWLAHYINRMAEAIGKNQFNTIHTDINQFLGRHPQPLNEYLKSVFNNNN